jgi:hypothetical protein
MYVVSTEEMRAARCHAKQYNTSTYDITVLD